MLDRYEGFHRVTMQDAGARPPATTSRPSRDALPAARPGAAERHVSTYAALSRQVQQEGLLQRRHGYYWTRIGGSVAAFAGLWAAVALLGDSWFQLVLAALMAVVSTQFGFLGHDAAHRQVFRSHAWNEWTARLLSGACAGLSYSWWMTKHNRHHAAPNQEGRDPDIAPGALAFTPAAVRARSGAVARLTRYQGWFFFPLLTLEGLNLHVAGVQTLLSPSAPVKHRFVEGGLVAARLAGFVAATVLLLPAGKAVAFLALHTAVFGVLLGGAFAPNHKGMPIVPATMKLDFLSRQVLMSRNIRGRRLTDFMMGGLNYQIEHHLFPNMPRPNLRRAQPLVRAHCELHGLPYTQTGLLASYAIVVRYLNTVGLGERDPFRCPLVTQHRA